MVVLVDFNMSPGLGEGRVDAFLVGRRDEFKVIREAVVGCFRVHSFLYCIKTVTGGCDFTIGDIVLSACELCDVDHM